MRALRREYRGYHPGRVDAFLARCLATPGVSRSQFPELRHLRPSGPPVTREEVDAVRFGPSTWGYRIRRVDDLLDRVTDALEPSRTRVPRVVTAPAPWRLVDAIRLPAGATAAGSRQARNPLLTQPYRPRT